MARKIGTTASEDDPDGRLALLLCESLLHVLVEKRVISKATALDAIDTVAELTSEHIERRKRQKGAGRDRRAATAIVQTMRASFEVKG
jgi:hypothetical protein